MSDDMTAMSHENDGGFCWCGPECGPTPYVLGYTPTTEEVHEAISEWVWSRRMFRPELGQSDGKEADRWLTVHDGAVAAAVREEGQGHARSDG